MSKLYFILVILSLFLTSCQSKKKLFERLIRSAKEDLSAQKYDQALKKLNVAIDMAPATESGYLLRGRLLYETGKYIESKNDFREVIKFNHLSVLAFFYLGLNSSALEQHDSAILFYNQAYTINGGDRFQLEITNQGIGKYLTEYVERKEILFYRGVSYYLNNDYRHAYQDFSYAINRNCNVEKSYMYLGLMETDLDNAPLGCKYLKLAVENGEEDAKKYQTERCR